TEIEELRVGLSGTRSRNGPIERPERLAARRSALEDSAFGIDRPSGERQHGARPFDPLDFGRIEGETHVRRVSDGHEPARSERNLLPPEANRESPASAVDADDVEEPLLELEVSDVRRPGRGLSARLPEAAELRESAKAPSDVQIGVSHEARCEGREVGSG